MTKHSLSILALLFNFVLAACNSSTQTVIPRPLDSGTQGPHSLATFTETPEVTPTYEGCAYVWAYRSLPEISGKVNQAIHALQPEASASAQAFGEDCVYADGHAEFGAMETDFYVTLMAKNLKDDKELGGWIINVMKALDAFPRGVVPGGQDGFVQFTFKTGQDQRVLNVQISAYKKLGAGLDGAQVMRALFPHP